MLSTKITKKMELRKRHYLDQLLNQILDLKKRFCYIGKIF